MEFIQTDWYLIDLTILVMSSCIIRTHEGKSNAGDLQQVMQNFNTCNVYIYVLLSHKSSRRNN